MALASLHHIRGWEMTTDGEVVDYLKMCLAPSPASRTHILQRRLRSYDAEIGDVIALFQ
jgi:hypothetical protein